MALVIVHPHLQHVPLDPDLFEEAPERRVVVPGDPPPAPLRERRHLLLLLRRELRPVPLPLRPRRRLRPRPAPRRLPVRHRRPEHVLERMDRADRLLVVVVLVVVVVVIAAVEVAVAAACRALERLRRAGVPARHELATAVVGLAADRRRVVAHALPVALSAARLSERYYTPAPLSLRNNK